MFEEWILIRMLIKLYLFIIIILNAAGKQLNLLTVSVK